MRDQGWIVACTLAVLFAVASPASARAQTPPDSGEPLFAPSLAASFAVAKIPNRDRMLPSVSVQKYFGRHIFLEGEWMKWSEHRTTFSPIFSPVPPYQPTGRRLARQYDKRTWMAGGSVLFTTGPRRLSMFAGAGAVWTDWLESSVLEFENCVPPPTGANPCAYPLDQTRFHDSGIVLQVSSGAELKLARAISAFVTAKFSGAEHARLRAEGGLRWIPLRTDVASIERSRTARLAGPDRSSVDRAIGREVRVVMNDGTRRRGWLAALEGTDVTLKRRAKTSVEFAVPLKDVQRVDLISNKLKKFGLIGLALGSGVGVLFAVSGESAEAIAAVPICAGIGTGIGALAGGLYDHAHGTRNVVWVSGRKTLTLAPVLAPRAAGVSATVVW